MAGAGAANVKPPPDQPAVVAVPVLVPLARVCDILSCSPRTVRRRIEDGDLPAVRGPNNRVMVRGDDLRAYVDGLELVGGRRPRRGARPRARPRATAHDFEWLGRG